MNNRNAQEFDLNTPYTLNEAAKILGQSADWVKRNAIKTGLLQFTPLGNSHVTTGRWIMDFVIANGTFEGDENCPTSNRGKAKRSPRTKTKGGDATS